MRSWRSTISSTPNASWRHWASVLRVWAHAPSGQDAPRRLPPTHDRERATSGKRWDQLRLSRLYHVWGGRGTARAWSGRSRPKAALPRAVAAVSDWCRQHRHEPIRDQHRHLSSMMRGHFAYYGVGGNIRRLRGFAIKWGDMAEVAVSARSSKRRHMDALQRTLETPSSAFSQDRQGYAAASESHS